MSETKLLARVKCPLWFCGEDGCEVREGEKGKAYIVCAECGSLLRSPIGKAQRAMRALVPAASAPAKEPKEKKLEPAPPPPAADKSKKPGTFF